MNSTNSQKEIILKDLSTNKIDGLAKSVTQRQKNTNFMRFLKEQAMDEKENTEYFINELTTPHVVLKSINISGITDSVGYVLFHNFDSTDNSLEISFRVNPDLQHKGICSAAVQKTLYEILEQSPVHKIVGWHSALNTGSFGVFKKNGFQIADFVPQQTYLPNIKTTTDDFKWEISRNLLLNKSDLAINQQNKSAIISGLQKHNLSF